jgi:hypothetical protein
VRSGVIGQLAIASLACAAFGALAQGSIHKCVGVDGKVTYQDGACDRSSQTAAQIDRDLRLADPLAIQRAQEEREWVREAAATRMEQERNDALNAAAARADADREARYQAEAAAAASAAEQPLYYYGPLLGPSNGRPSRPIAREIIRERPPRVSHHTTPKPKAATSTVAPAASRR